MNDCNRKIGFLFKLCGVKLHQNCTVIFLSFNSIKDKDCNARAQWSRKRNWVVGSSLARGGGIGVTAPGPVL